MKKIVVTSDSTCSLPREEAAKIGLNILPLNVIVDGVEYHDGIDIHPEKLALMMRNGSVIKTSTPTPYEIETFFDKLFEEGYEEIIHFTISSKLSSMYELFVTTCKEKYGDKVLIIDSRAICVFMLNHVLTARELVAKGMSKEEIEKVIKQRLGSEVVNFIPESLTFLKRGGRVSPAVAAIGNLIGMKPILAFVDGGIEKDGTTRNIKKSVETIALKFKGLKLDPSTHEVSIIVFDTAPALVEFTKKTIERVLSEFSINTGPIAINVCAHTGPGTIGIGIHRKINA